MPLKKTSTQDRFENNSGLGLGLDSSGNAILDGSLTFKSGGAADTVKPGGVLLSQPSVAGVGNVGTGDDVLASYAVPAALLAVDNQSIWFEAAGVFAANANSKTLRVRFGTSGTNLVLDTGNVVVGSTAVNWFMRGRITRVGATAQISDACCWVNPVGLTGGAVIVNVVLNLNQTLSGSITLSIRGEATSNNDILCHRLHVGFDEANT